MPLALKGLVATSCIYFIPKAVIAGIKGLAGHFKKDKPETEQA